MIRFPLIGLTLGLAGGGLVLAAAAPAHARTCDHTTDGAIAITVVRDVDVGPFTRPDLADGERVVTIAPDSTVSLPPELRVSDRAGVTPVGGIVEIAGGADCDFVLDVTLTTGDLFNVTFAPASGYQFLSGGSGTATGRLDVTGRFALRVGLSARVSGVPGHPFGGGVTLQTRYR